MFAESFVWVDDGQVGSLPADFAGLGLSVPEVFGDQEVVVLQFSKEVAGRDVEVSRSSIEVIVNSVSLGGRGLPGAVIAVGVEN